MKPSPRFIVGATLLTAFAALAATGRVLEKSVAAQSGKVPTFQVDPLWPKPLPNKWVMGSVIGVGVDSKDHIWMIHRLSTIDRNEIAAAQNPPISECCFPAPPVLVFDQAGNLIHFLERPDDPRAPTGGARAEVMPKSEHGLYIDHRDNVWLADNDANAGEVVKLSQAGKHLLTIGAPLKPAKDSNDISAVHCATNMFVERTANEVYVADGYCNRRLIVFDADTGAYKRHWGAYGKKPDDSDMYNSGRAQVGKDYDPTKVSQQFGRAVHGVEISKDGLVYVNDRTNNRIQVFRQDGTFVSETFINRNSRWYGSSFETAFSADPGQQFVYNTDGTSQRITILDRKSMQIIGSFGQGGRYPGQFYAVHSIATDSKGNIYTGETNEGKRLQRFLYKGLGPASTKSTR
jgi:hypothetical protein